MRRNDRPGRGVGGFVCPQDVFADFCNGTIMPPDKNSLIDTTECAELLGISPGTLRHWVSQRKISFVKIGRLTKFKLADIQKYIDDHTVQAENGEQLEISGDEEFRF
jgi:excisionase family DNA binding protein